MIEEVTDYARGLGASEEVLAWCGSTLIAAHRKAPVTLIEAEHIIDFLISEDAPSRLRRMSFAQAKAGADAWTKTQQKRGKDLIEGPDDIETFMDLGNGNKVVKLLTQTAFKREGFLMRHCSGSYSPDKASIYSLRDKDNEPHVTFEVTSDGGTVQQIKGKGNGSIHPRYIESTLTFLERIGLKIRPTDMINLGYYHVTVGAKAVLEKFERAGKGPEFIRLGGNEYIFKGV